MRLNSDTSLALARALYREHDSDWGKVAAAGRVREDGVIVVKRPAPSDEARTVGQAAAPRRVNGRG